jgi:myo-inositol-1(or 4)-monophosphatase
MSEISLDFLAKVEAIAKQIGEFQLLHWNHVKAESIEDKGLNQLVSFVDQQSEQMLVDKLGEILPSATFIGEEKAPNNRTLTQYTWIIDPLDGTTNFLHGLPVFSISIALMNHKEPILGVVYCPALKESFVALKNKGAFLNGQKIEVARNANFNDTLIATGFPYYQFEKVDEYLQVLSTLMRKTHGLRRMGSAAIDLAYTACGRFDAFFEMNLSPWDIAAGIVLVQEAGGLCTDFSGGGDIIFKNEIVACSKDIYDPFVKELSILI